MSTKKRVVLLLLLSVIPFFGFGHVRSMTNWFCAYLFYVIIYFLYGLLIRKNGFNRLQNHLILIIPLLIYPILLYTEDKEYYYPGIAPTIFLTGCVGYTAGLFFMKSKLLVTFLLFVFIFSELFSYKVLLPQYFYNKMVHNTSLSKIEGIRPELIFQDLDGKTVSKRYFENKVVVLDFWFTGCEACILKHSEYEAVHKYFLDNPDVLIASVVDGQYSSREAVKSFLSKHPYKFLTFYDPRGNFSKKYNLSVDGYPVEIRIDRTGKVVGTVWSFGSKEIWYNDLVFTIEKLIKQ